ncbi:MAG TPA: helix-hairpin-helix domain-containing protein [Chloroflexia bacterium]|jgi:predicted flap endonuclease-1-like 5' DNA nuclease
MLRWLLRLLFVGLILAAIGFVVSRLMGQDEDFDDFDDLEPGFEFEETPVEIDVPADDGASAGAGGGAATADLNAGADSARGDDGANEGDEGDEGGTGTKLTDITGIGPAYEARLQAIGIESVDDLLNADPANLAEQLGVIGGQSAVEDWLAQARQLAADGSQGADGGA